MVFSLSDSPCKDYNARFTTEPLIPFLGFGMFHFFKQLVPTVLNIKSQLAVIFRWKKKVCFVNGILPLIFLVNDLNLINGVNGTWSTVISKLKTLTARTPFRFVFNCNFFFKKRLIRFENNLRIDGFCRLLTDSSVYCRKPPFCYGALLLPAFIWSMVWKIPLFLLEPKVLNSDNMMGHMKLRSQSFYMQCSLIISKIIRTRTIYNRN